LGKVTQVCRDFLETFSKSFSSLDNISIIGSRYLKRTGLKAQVERIGNVYNTLVRKLEGRDLLKDLAVDCMLIKKLNFRDYSQRIGFVWRELVMDSFEQDGEHLFSMESGGNFERLIDR